MKYKILFSIMLIIIIGSAVLHASSNSTQTDNTNDVITETGQIKTVYNPGQIAFIKTDIENDENDIWISENKNSTLRKLTALGNINRIYSWSPDNSHLLASLAIEEDNKILTEYVSVDTDSGDAKPIPISRDASGDGASNFVWTTDNAIAYIDKDVMYQVSLDGIKEQIHSIPAESQAILYVPNSSLDKIAYDTSGPMGPGFTRDMLNVFVYDLSTGKSSQVSIDGNAYLLGWLGDSIVYQQDGVMKKFDTNQGSSSILVDMEGWYVLDIAFSISGEKIFYVADNRGLGTDSITRLFVYDVVLQEQDLINEFEKMVYADDLSLSRAADWGSYTLTGKVGGNSAIVNFSDNTMTDLCESYCRYPIWQN